MIPVVTPSQMADIDEQAVEPIEVLIKKAGQAVAWRARKILKGTYGKRVTIIVGKGNNGADGLEAARRLRGWGVKVHTFQSDSVPYNLKDSDLLIDAAVGTGLKRPYQAPEVSFPILSVDIPSGICGLSGDALGTPVNADETITFQALKTGHLLSKGPSHSGRITVADIGLDVSHVCNHLLEKSDVTQILNEMNHRDHKWVSACWVIGGSEGMKGAPLLSSKAALRSGSGYVRMSIPSGFQGDSSEIVRFDMPSEKWDACITDSELRRFKSLVIGPGLGRSSQTLESVQKLTQAIHVPIVVDADALYAIGQQRSDHYSYHDTFVLTPHDAEYQHLTGHKPEKDRVSDVRDAAKKLNATILLKGPATVIAHPNGRCFIVNNGDQRLATAGTGDVLSGIIGGLLSRGIAPFEAAAAGAWLHAEAAKRCSSNGMIASDIINALPEVLCETDMG